VAPTKPLTALTALDVCDRCGAQAYVRVLLANSGELLFVRTMAASTPGAGQGKEWRA
jgi:hypothetical protein